MSTLWYYAHDKKKHGPFSQGQLKEMAAAGTILPIDTVWKEGVEQGVEASRVKNLFPQPVINSTYAIDAALLGAAPPVQSAPLADVPAFEPIVVNTNLVPLEEPEPPKAKPKAPEKTVKKGRAVALKGADIVSQDGTHARYRKKCTKCGHNDSACHMIAIANRLVKENFFCPKCRKRREVAIQCHL